MITLITVVHVAICLFLIVIVLLQHGKGADVGATFGGSGQSLFGTEGPLPLLNKITTTVAILFMLTSVSLAYFSSSKSTGTVMSDLPKSKAAVVEKVEAKIEKEEKIVPMPLAAPENQEVVPAAENNKSVLTPESQTAAPLSTEGTATEKK